VSGIRLVSSFCDVCTTVSRSISWARRFACGYRGVRVAAFLKNGALV